MKVATYRLVRKIAPKFAEKNFGSAEYKSLSPLMKESYKKIVNEDLRACAAMVENSVLIVEGSKDTVTTMAEAQAYARCMKNAQLKIIEGGHFAFAEHPVAFQILTENFLYV